MDSFKQDRLRLLSLPFRVIGIALGGVQVWIGRDIFQMDGVCYLDLADAWSEGQRHAALNGLWSPLYPWLFVLVDVLHFRCFKSFNSG